MLLFLTLLRPFVFCLQETYLKPNDKFTFKGFNVYNHIHSDCLRAAGGSSLLVHSSLPQRQVELKTDLQAVAVSVTLEKEITFCSIYIPPSYSLISEQLTSLLQQLPSPCILLLQHHSLAFVAGLKRATDEGPLPEIAKYSPYYLLFTASKGSNLYFLFAIIAAGVVPCGGRKKSSRTSSIVLIIFSFRSFEISKDTQSVQNTRV